ncbi:hypothetical protein [Staphylococcus simulans]|uniref:hypothetical protein n=1 Tax=Staphylococcus simulans TaxID=1286 RepID=UPI00070FF248|nr:hypothetical protein [Staphylococcus simulans]
MTEFVTLNKYLEDEKRREIEKGKIHQRINNVDNKHIEKNNDLKLIIMTFIESQKPLNDHMKGIRDDLKEVNDVLKEYAKKTDEIEDNLRDIQQEQGKGSVDRNKFLLSVLAAATGAGGFVPVLIQTFFK